MIYPEELITQVREANDIVDVIGQHVKLEKKGTYYFGLCPFHGEKTASFSVDPRKQICYCFGCHKGGNVVSFIMEYEHLNFPEAVKYLADRANIRLPEVKESQEEKKNRQLREKLLDINREAAYFYHDRLLSPEGSIGLDYFYRKRSLSPKTITHFGLGYASKTSGELYRHLKNKGFSDEELKESGLVTIEETGTKDKFWNRVMFPIMDINGKVIAFGGRVLGDGLPKYLNSPETKLFEKSSVLYGLNFARKTTEKYLLLCEGYMDVIALHQAGFTNAVASLGTAFTDRHAKLLKRYTDTVVLTQDSDEAGIQAKIRSFPILHSAGLKVKILNLGDYKDPDEFIKAKGPEAYRECIQKAKNAFLVNVEAVKKRYDLSDPAQVTDYLNEVASMLLIFSDELERDSYIQAVSREQLIDYPQLKHLVEKKAGKRFSEMARSAGTTGSLAKNIDTETDRRLEKAENLLLYWMNLRPELIHTIQEHLLPADFSSQLRQRMAARLYQDCIPFEPATYFDQIESENDRKTALEIFTGGTEAENLEKLDDSDLCKLLSEAIRTVRNALIEKQLKQENVDMIQYQKLLRKREEIKRLQIKV